jgi:hypothetical protein
MHCGQIIFFLKIKLYLVLNYFFIVLMYLYQNNFLKNIYIFK